MERNRINGHIFYITTVVYNRLPIFTNPRYIIPLFDSFNYYRYQYSFLLLGFVIMPDHIHLLIYPQQATQVSNIMRDFKKFTSVRIIRQATVERNQKWLDAFVEGGIETGRSTNKVWQDEFWEVHIFTERLLKQKLNYIHRNPVRAGLVTEPQAYPYSSYRNYTADDESLIEVDRGWLH